MNYPRNKINLTLQILFYPQFLRQYIIFPQRVDSHSFSSKFLQCFPSFHIFHHSPICIFLSNLLTLLTRNFFSVRMQGYVIQAFVPSENNINYNAEFKYKYIQTYLTASHFWTFYHEL